MSEAQLDGGDASNSAVVPKTVDQAMSRHPEGETYNEEEEEDEDDEEEEVFEKRITFFVFEDGTYKVLS